MSAGEFPDEDESASLNSRAVALIETHNYAEAQLCLERALEIDARTVTEESPQYFDTLSNLGMLKFYAGKYSEAEPLLTRTLEARRRMLGEQDPLFALSLNNLAGLYQAIGQTSPAERYLEQALRIRRDRGTPVEIAQSLNNLALLYRQSGRYRQAEPLYLQGLQLYREQLGEQHPKYTNMLANLAGVYFGLGDYRHAEELLRGVLDARTQRGDPAWTLGTVLNNLATLDYARHSYEAAEARYRQVIQTLSDHLGSHHPRLRTALSNLGGLYVAMQRVTDALPVMRRLMAIDDQLICDVLPILTERQRMEYVGSIQQNLDDLLFLATKHFAASTSVVSEVFDVVLRRKGIGAELLAARRDGLLAGKYPALELMLSELNSARVSLGSRILAGPGSEGIAAHTATLEHLTAAAEKLEAALAHESSELDLGKVLQATDRRRIAQALPRGAVLIEFVRFNGATV